MENRKHTHFCFKKIYKVYSYLFFFPRLGQTWVCKYSHIRIISIILILQHIDSPHLQTEVLRGVLLVSDSLLNSQPHVPGDRRRALNKVVLKDLHRKK